VRFKVSINKKDALAAGLLCLFGLAAVLQVSAYSVGKTSGMATLGVVPVLIGSLVMLVGILCLFESRLSPDDDDDHQSGLSKWRGCCGIASGTFAFLLLGKYIGLVPAVFAFVFIMALGDRSHTWRSALFLSACVTLVGALALMWGPELHIPLLN